MIATKRLSTLVGTSTSAQAFGANIAQFKAESEKEQVDEVRLTSAFTSARTAWNETLIFATGPQRRALRQPIGRLERGAQNAGRGV